LEPCGRDRRRPHPGCEAPGHPCFAPGAAALSAGVDLRHRGGRSQSCCGRGPRAPPPPRCVDPGRAAACPHCRRRGAAPGPRLDAILVDATPAGADGGPGLRYSPELPTEKGAPMLTRLANPARFMRVSGVVLPWLGGACAGVLGLGLCWSLVIAPP